MRRQLVVVDCETTGLDDHHVAVEIAWHNVTTGRAGCFIPKHTPSDLEHADPQSLTINGYLTRLADQPHDDGAETEKLWRVLDGNTIAGSNPAFDAGKLSTVFARAGLPPRPSHHRTADLATLAAAKLGLPMTDLPGLEKVCLLLGVVNTAPHTAQGDVTATVECLRALHMRFGGVLA